MANKKIRSEILGRQQSAFDYLKTKRELWDNAEKLFHNKLNDAVSSKTKSKVFDPKLATLTLERAYRVMAQMQTGKVIPVSKNDMGASKLMNLILDKYVLKHANAQFDFLTKMRMVDLYSNIYGNFFTLTDWDVKENGYVGPDVWMLNIRDVFPQVGAVSLEDSDYVIVRSWKPISYFESIAKQKGYKNVGKIIDKLKEKSGSKQNRDTEDKSQRDQDQYPDAVAAKKSGYFEVLTQFERDRWVDYSVDTDLVFRDIENPHDNGELPVDCKYSIPLLDDFMGMGDFERGGSMQMTINSIWNLYLDSVKMSIYPPTLINKDNIASMSSLKWGAAEKWLVRNQINNAVQPVPLSPQGTQTFNNTFQVAAASLLNMFGTTDTTTTSQTDPGFGKTPQAIEHQQQRENTRDNADRFYMEQYLTRISKKMVNLISKKQTSSITVRLFEEELDDLARDYEEVREMYDEKTGKLTIPKKNTGDILYDYEIVSGSTYAVDQKTQQDNLNLFLQLYLKAQTPQGNMLVADLKNEGYEFKFGELFKRIMGNSGIQDWDKILSEMSEGEKDQNILAQDAQALQQMMAEAQAQMQGMNSVPAQPNGQVPGGQMGSEGMPGV